jgi:hypothetical protein
VLGRFLSDVDLPARRLRLLPRRSAVTSEVLDVRTARWPELPRCPPSGRRARGPAASFARCVTLGPLEAAGATGRVEVELAVDRLPAAGVRLLLAVASEAGTPLPAPYRLGIIVSPAQAGAGAPPRGRAGRQTRRVLLPRLPDDLEPRLRPGARLALVDAVPHAEMCPVSVCTFWQRR